MTTPDPRQHTRALAHESLRHNDPIGWFERLYAESAGDMSQIPWADHEPNPHLVHLIKQLKSQTLKDQRVIVVGCGLGDDAEYLAQLGAKVTAFDVSPTAIAWAKKRFPNSPVTYLVADVFTPPSSWHQYFDVVIEIYTIQALPHSLRSQVTHAIVDLVRPSGRLVLIARYASPERSLDGPPWPLTPADIQMLEAHGFEVETKEEARDEQYTRLNAIYKKL